MAKGYRKIFLAHHGDGPYPCHFCGEEMSIKSLIVHHVDHDRTNNAIENLVPAHHGCHVGYHSAIINLGRSLGPESRKLISEKMTGRVVEQETREKLSALRKGQPERNTEAFRSPEAREKISTYNRNRTAEHQAKLSASLKGKNTGPRSDEIKQKVSEGLKRYWAEKKGSAA